MKTSYKFWYVTKQDDIHISEVAVRFYEGEISTQKEKDKDFKDVDVTRYRRTKRLQKEDLPHIDKPTKKELSGDDCIIYTDKDFGVTDDLDVVREFLNSELAKDNSREPEDNQKVI